MTLVSVSIVVMGGLLSIIGLLLTRALNSNSSTLKNFRDDLKSLFNRVENTEKEVAYLKGQHEARTGMKMICEAKSK
jgi:hypothetical protein